MTPAEAARAIEDVLAQLEATVGRRVTRVTLGEFECTEFQARVRTFMRHVQFDFDEEIEYLPFKGSAA